MSRDEIRTALEHLRSGGYRPGPEMEAAHELCQRHEGEAAFDWMHALVHRIEGDEANAGYWYRRAGRNRHAGSAEDEWTAIRAAILPD